MLYFCISWKIQRRAEALIAHKGNLIAVRSATGSRVGVPKISLSLSVNCFDFDITERCLFLDLDIIYYIILGMTWIERHEPWS